MAEGERGGPVRPNADGPSFDTQTLASLMDGTRTLNDLRDDELGPLLRAMEPDELLQIVADAPKVFDRGEGRMSTTAAGSVSWLRLPPFFGWPAVAAAAVLMVAAAAALYVRTRPAATPSDALPEATTVRTGPVAGGEIARALPPPVILVQRFAEPGAASTPEFRNNPAGGRAAKSEGAILSIDDSDVSIDLGSLDGVSKDAVLPVFGGNSQATATARVTITRVFRDRATGTLAPTGAAKVGDKVELPLDVRVSAMLDGAAARLASGDSAGARALAEQAATTARSPAVAATMRRRALALLGLLEYRAGALDAAERDLRSAVSALDTAGTSAPVTAETRTEAGDLLSDFGAVLVERGHDDEAESILRRARAAAAGAALVRATNNLAVIAERRSDVPAAERLYREALTLAGGSPDLEPERTAIERNLARLGGSR